MGTPINRFSRSPKPSPSSQIPLHQFQNSNPHQLIHNRNLSSDFFDQMLSAIPSWPDLTADKPVACGDAFQFAAPYDESSLLAARLRQQQIGAQQQQNQLLPSATSDSDSSFKSPNSTGVGFKGSQPQHFHQPPQGASIPPQSFGGSPLQATSSTAIGAAARQRVRARRGQATDPHSIAERLRRERIAERMKALQGLVPNANKTDKASMLDEIIDYVKFLRLQVKVLSMSRLGGAASVSPLIADIPSQGQGLAAASETISTTESLVAKLMEEDMGSAMQYLQGKGLCIMPISIASAISTVTSPSVAGGLLAAGRVVHAIPTGGDAPPSSPSTSVLTVQSAAAFLGPPARMRLRDEDEEAYK